MNKCNECRYQTERLKVCCRTFRLLGFKNYIFLRPTIVLISPLAPIQSTYHKLLRDIYETKTNHSSLPFLLSNPSEMPNYTKNMAYRVLCDLTPLQSLLLTHPDLSSKLQLYQPFWLSSPSLSLP